MSDAPEQYVDSNGNLVLEYNVGRLIGNGSYGYCFLAWEVHEPTKKFVIKRVKVTYSNDIPQEELLKRQFDSMEKGNLGKFLAMTKKQTSPHVIRYFWAYPRSPRILYEDGFGHIVIRMDYANGGNLENFMILCKPLLEDSIVCFIKQVIQGLDYLHKNAIIHGDLKPANILLHRETPETEWMLKICDWDNAVKIEDTRTSRSDVKAIVGTPRYMSPEMLIWRASTETAEDYPGRSTDIWSLGCVVLFMIGKPVPPKFNARPNELVFDKLRHQLLSDTIFLINGEDVTKLKQLTALGGSVEPDFKDGQHINLKSLVTRCCMLRPTERPTPEDLLKSSILKYTRYSSDYYVPDESPHENVHRFIPYDFGLLPSPKLWTVYQSSNTNSIYMKSWIMCMDIFEDEYHAELRMICESFEQKKNSKAIKLTALSMKSVKLLGTHTWKVVKLSFEQVNGWNSDCLEGVNFANLELLTFSHCHDITFRKGHWKGCLKLHTIQFNHSSVAHVEEDVFRELPHLEYFGVEKHGHQCFLNTSHLNWLLSTPGYIWLQALVENRQSLFGKCTDTAVTAVRAGTTPLPSFEMKQFNRDEIVSVLGVEPVYGGWFGGSARFDLSNNDGSLTLIIQPRSPWLVKMEPSFSTEGEQLVGSQLRKLMELKKDHPLKANITLGRNSDTQQQIRILKLISNRIISLRINRHQDKFLLDKEILHWSNLLNFRKCGGVDDLALEEKFVLDEEIGGLDWSNLLEFEFSGFDDLVLEKRQIKFPRLRALRFFRCKIPDIAEELLNDMHALEFRHMKESWTSLEPETTTRVDRILRCQSPSRNWNPLRPMCFGEVWQFKGNGYYYQSEPFHSDEDLMQHFG